MKANEADPITLEFSPIADRVERLLNTLEADSKRKRARTEAVRPLKEKIEKIERGGGTSATAERLLQDDLDVERGHGGVQRMLAAPLDRLHKQGFIVRAEFEAGDRYRADAYLSAIDPAAGSVDWEQAGGGGRSAKVPTVFSSQIIADARIRMREIEGKISGAIRIVARLALVKELPTYEIGASVFGYRDRKDAEVAGRVATRMACAALVDVYRL